MTEGICWVGEEDVLSFLLLLTIVGFNRAESKDRRYADTNINNEVDNRKATEAETGEDLSIR